MSTTIISFDCGAGIVVESGQTVQSVITDHESCGICVEIHIEKLEQHIEALRQRAHAARQKKWEAKVDAALAEARRTA